MSGDRKWVIIGIAITSALGLGAIWYPVIIGRWQECVTLYAADKMSLPELIDCRNTATVLMTAPIVLVVVGAIVLAVLWQRRKLEAGCRYLRRAWPYVWPVLTIGVTVLLPFAALFASSIPALLLSVVPPIFMVYLVHSLLARPPEKRELWQFNFIAHLQDQTTREYATGSPRGKVVKVVTNVRSGTEMGEAILEHPPEQGDTVVEYIITAIDRAVTRVKLHGNYGIIEQFTDDDGQVKVSQFPRNRGNRVRFEIRVNRQVVFQDDINDFGWRQLKVDPFAPQEGSLTVEFRTNSMADPSWNWAAWSELKLVEKD